MRVIGGKSQCTADAENDDKDHCCKGTGGSHFEYLWKFRHSIAVQKKPTLPNPEVSGFNCVGLLVNGSVAATTYPLFSHPRIFSLAGADSFNAPRMIHLIHPDRLRLEDYRNTRRAVHLND
jgi:hypothetical protein